MQKPTGRAGTTLVERRLLDALFLGDRESGKFPSCPRIKAMVDVHYALIVRAEHKYTPALSLIEAGATYEEAAMQIGVPKDRLAFWVRHHQPDLNGRARQNVWVVLRRRNERLNGQEPDTEE